ncbi:MAG: hypothetical protein FWC89_04770 [Defluviitaleaceae bacterium]|nr:hypothetical protein [Defluviitaleaceae bacterium]
MIRPVASIGEAMGYNVEWINEWRLVCFMRRPQQAPAIQLLQADTALVEVVYFGNVKWRGGAEF